MRVPGERSPDPQLPNDEAPLSDVPKGWILTCPLCGGHVDELPLRAWRAYGAISFREAKWGDAAALGLLHVASWRETYAGLLPGQLLDGVSAEARSATWSAILDDPAAHGGTAVFVAESEDRIVGFGACGDQRDEALRERGFGGEVGAIYVLRSHQRVGAGSSLMSLMARSLLDRGRAAATLWVLRENASARLFYERLGGALAGERTDEQSGVTVIEVAYGWSDLSLLVR